MSIATSSESRTEVRRERSHAPAREDNSPTDPHVRRPREYQRSGTGRPQRAARAHGFDLPECKRVLEAELLERDGRVVLDRTCPEHGRFEAVVYGDAAR